MAQFRPQFTVRRNRDNNHLFGDYPYETAKTFVFPTYRELKQKMKGIMKEHNVTEISVSRSRRGEWGEWFENWSLHGEVLTIDKEGWM